MNSAYDLTFIIKGENVRKSVSYISEVLFRHEFEKFTLDVNRDEDDNLKLNVDVWQDVTEKDLFPLCKIFSIGIRNKFVGNIYMTYTIRDGKHCKHNLIGTNEQSVIEEISNNFKGEDNNE